MSIKRAIQQFTVTLALASLSLTVFAADDGQLGSSSSGNVTINLVSNLVVKISGIQDIDLGEWPGNGDLEANYAMCVGGNIGNRRPIYKIRAEGSGAPNDPNGFGLSNGVDTIPFRLFFNDRRGLGGREELTAGVELDRQRSPRRHFRRNADGCVRTNANISVQVDESVIDEARAGAYKGTITITLIPDEV